MFLMVRKRWANVTPLKAVIVVQVLGWFVVVLLKDGSLFWVYVVDHVKYNHLTPCFSSIKRPRCQKANLSSENRGWNTMMSEQMFILLIWWVKIWILILYFWWAIVDLWGMGKIAHCLFNEENHLMMLSGLTQAVITNSKKALCNGIQRAFFGSQVTNEVIMSKFYVDVQFKNRAVFRLKFWRATNKKQRKRLLNLARNCGYDAAVKKQQQRSLIHVLLKLATVMAFLVVL